MTKRPILFLDVDGVLNAFPRGYEKRAVQLDLGCILHFTKHTKPFMRWAWSIFDVQWCTTWGERANRIAEWASLPPRPCVVDIQRLGEDWKLHGVKQFMRGKREPAVWIEDGIWVKKKKGFIYVESDPHVGVTKAQATQLSKRLNLSMEGWSGKH